MSKNSAAIMMAATALALADWDRPRRRFGKAKTHNRNGKKTEAARKRKAQKLARRRNRK